MGIGIGVFFLAAGAILRFAVETEADGIDLDMVGLILMGVGAIAVLFGIFALESMRNRRIVRDDTVTRRDEHIHRAP